LKNVRNNTHVTKNDPKEIGMNLRISVLAIFFTLFSTTLMAANNVVIKKAWIREAPPVMKMLAGYMELHNMGKNAVMLRSVNCSDFDRVEIHRTEIVNGMAEMKPASNVIINPGKVLTFKPGGYHLMLINPHKPLKAGDKVDFTLNFSDGSSQPFTATVKKGNGMEGDSSHDMNMKNMKHDM
jgi:hypothetical protein